MSRNTLSPITWLSLVANFVFQILPLINSKFSDIREFRILVFSASIIFLVIFTSSILVKLNEFKLEVHKLINNQEVLDDRIKLLKTENQILKQSMDRSNKNQ